MLNDVKKNKKKGKKKKELTAKARWRRWYNDEWHLPATNVSTCAYSISVKYNKYYSIGICIIINNTYYHFYSNHIIFVL